MAASLSQCQHRVGSYPATDVLRLVRTLLFGSPYLCFRFDQQRIPKSLQTTLRKTDWRQTMKSPKLHLQRKKGWKIPPSPSSSAVPEKPEREGSTYSRTPTLALGSGRPETLIYAWGSYFWEARGKNSSPKVHTPPDMPCLLSAFQES